MVFSNSSFALAALSPSRFEMHTWNFVFKSRETKTDTEREKERERVGRGGGGVTGSFVNYEVNSNLLSRRQSREPERERERNSERERQGRGVGASRYTPGASY